MLLQIIATVVKILPSCKRRKNEEVYQETCYAQECATGPLAGGRKCSRGKNVSERQGEPPLPLLLCLLIIIFNFCFDDLTIVFTANTEKGNMKDHSREVCHYYVPVTNLYQPPQCWARAEEEKPVYLSPASSHRLPRGGVSTRLSTQTKVEVEMRSAPK